MYSKVNTRTILLELVPHVTPADLHEVPGPAVLHEPSLSSDPEQSAKLRKTGLSSAVGNPSTATASIAFKNTLLIQSWRTATKGQLPLGLYPSCRQTTLASLLSHPLLQTVPQVLWRQYSTRPLDGLKPSLSLTSPSSQLVFSKHTYIRLGLHT